jgi:hypothetical protein
MIRRNERWITLVKNCKYRHTWDCDDGGYRSRCGEFKLDEDTLNEEERRMLRVLRQVMSEQNAKVEF